MLNNQLSSRLQEFKRKLTGQGRLTENNIQETLREIRVALLEADVALPVAKAFIDNIQSKVIGTEVLKSLSPGEVLIKLVNDELVKVMGEFNEELKLNTQPPAVILMAGLQGSGKTTTVAKLARWLSQTQKKAVMVASADVYRPAAIDQLAALAEKVGVDFFPSHASEDPVAIAQGAIQAAKNKVIDVVIIDTAGRLHIDAEMMDEIKRLHTAIQPVETLFVVDSMTGQDAANTAKAFDDALPLTGVILTKTDGDSRGGAALSIRHITGKPIKFMGVGEKIDALEAFHPDRMASRILGMGDIVSLVEQVQQNIDPKSGAKLLNKVKKGHFDLTTFAEQLQTIKKMGGASSIMKNLPLAGMPPQMQGQFSDKKLVEIEAIISSMTPKERRYPDIIRNSQKRRIAQGSGTSIQTINQLLKQFLMMKKIMKKMSSQGGMMKMLRAFQGKLPFGGGGFPL